MNRSGLTLDSHSGKLLRHILETLPREELFQSGDEALYRTAMGILGVTSSCAQPFIFALRQVPAFYLSASVCAARVLQSGCTFAY
ncbi:hypothetical protein ACOAD5_12615 [Xylella fastidiosa]|uniref:hypothetical protein n=1 Tax=Xylella fastidiosa TaxID=2371 RepID=UPI003DA1E62C